MARDLVPMGEVRGLYACFVTSIVQSLTSATTAPSAAHIGARATPTTPTVSGNSTMVLRSESLMTTRRTLPSCTSCLILAMTSSPVSW